eukprot:6403401-Ditylum_brightwellii.AAC.1
MQSKTEKYSDQLQQLNGLPAKFKSYQYNIASFCNYVINCVKMLKSARGKDNQAPEKLVEALTTLPSTEFNSNIHSHHSACCTNSTLLNINTIVDLAQLN